MNKPKSLIVMFIQCLTMFYANQVGAHDQLGMLGPDPSATDHYMVICDKKENDDVEPQYLETKLIAYKKSSAIVSMQVASTNPQTIVSITDPIGGDKIFSKTEKTFNVDKNGNGGGVYFITVNKSGAGIQSYQLKYHCMSKNGNEVEVYPTTLQNQ